jgi:hypothetical protein
MSANTSSGFHLGAPEAHHINRASVVDISRICRPAKCTALTRRPLLRRAQKRSSGSGNARSKEVLEHPLFTFVGALRYEILNLKLLASDW